MRNRYVSVNSLLRIYCGLNYTCDRTPIEIIEGDSEPKRCGQRWHYTNKSGELILHPSAYMKAFGKPIYHPSTRKIQVGKSWIAWLKTVALAYDFAAEEVKNGLEIKQYNTCKENNGKISKNHNDKMC